MSQKVGDIIKSLSQRDVDALKSIYSFRCLTTQQVYELHYKKSLRTDEEVSDNYCKRKISEFTSLGLIEKVSYADNEVYFLTAQGVEVVKYCFDLPNNIYDAKKKVAKRGYYRASELKISNKYINHQVHTNQFLIDFQLREYDFYWKYFDEKHISQFSGIRPDGLLTMFDTDFFIEMDMATESKKQLLDKWINYRHFLNTREYQYAERKIVVLFVIEGTNKVQARIDLIRHTINEGLLDQMDGNFEVYVDTKDNLLQMLEDKYITAVIGSSDFSSRTKEVLREKHGFEITPGEKVQPFFNGTDFSLYCRLRVPDSKNVRVENNKIQEYVFDDYFYSPLSVMKKIAYLENANTFFNEKFGRDMAYVVVAEHEKQIYHDLKVMDLLCIQNVYYTTLERLETMPFHQALFQFDFLGNVHTFKNNGLEERVFEANIEDYVDISTE